MNNVIGTENERTPWRINHVIFWVTNPHDVVGNYLPSFRMMRKRRTVEIKLLEQRNANAVDPIVSTHPAERFQSSQDRRTAWFFESRLPFFG